MREAIENTWGWDEEWQRTDFERRFHRYVASVIEYEGRPIGGLMLEPAETLREHLRVAEFAARAHFRAATHGVPRRNRPLNSRAVAHRGPVYALP